VVVVVAHMVMEVLLFVMVVLVVLVVVVVVCLLLKLEHREVQVLRGKVMLVELHLQQLTAQQEEAVALVLLVLTVQQIHLPLVMVARVLHRRLVARL
jgi:hypothetical protein